MLQLNSHSISNCGPESDLRLSCTCPGCKARDEFNRSVSARNHVDNRTKIRSCVDFNLLLIPRTMNSDQKTMFVFTEENGEDASMHPKCTAKFL